MCPPAPGGDLPAGPPPAPLGFLAARDAPVSGAGLLGDLNHDGKLDLVGLYGEPAFFLANDGTGRFTTPPTVLDIMIDVGSCPDIFYEGIRDLNGDGLDDIVFACAGQTPSDPTSIVVRLQGPNETFAPVVQDPGPTNAAGPAALADVDGDGDLDFVTVGGDQANGYVVNVLPNQGTGAFGPPVVSAIGPVDTGNAAMSMAMADLDGDGKPDLAVTGFQSGTVTVLLNEGQGTFGPPSTFTAGRFVTSIATADVDGDGSVDLTIVAEVPSGEGWAVNVLRNQGHATFAAPVSYLVGVSPLNHVVADFSGDGKPDILTLNEQSDDLSLLVNRGDGTFTDEVRLVGPYNSLELSAGDLDGDGRPDAVVFNGDTWLLLSSVARPLGTPIVHPAGPRPTDGTWSFFNAVALGDVDGDGRPDLAVTDADDDRVGVLINAGNGTFGPARELSEAQASHPDAVAFGDLNGDGRLDLAVGNVNGVNVALNDGTGVFPAVSPFHPSPQVLSLAIGDLNGDGRADIVAGRYQGLDVLLATSGVTTATSYAMPGAGSMSVTLGDVTGDGKPDIVLALRGPPPQVSILVNQGDGSFVADPTPLKTGGPPVAVAIGDLDGDGRADLAVGTEPDQVCTSSGNLALFFNRGDRFDGPFRLGRDDYGAVAIADVDGNGTLDVAAGGRGILELYLNDGTGVFSAPVRYAGLAAPSMMVAGDVDGDGRTDLALADQDGRVAVYLNSATVTSR